MKTPKSIMLSELLSPAAIKLELTSADRDAVLAELVDQIPQLSGQPELRQTLLRCWGDALAARATRPSSLPGGIAARRHGLRGASAEAALGFPVLFDTALPALQAAAARGLARQQVLLETLFQVMAVLDDSNLAHRGGLEGLRHAQQSARKFLAAGGAARLDCVAAAHDIGRDFVGRRLSPPVLRAVIVVVGLAAIAKLLS